MEAGKPGVIKRFRFARGDLCEERNYSDLEMCVGMLESAQRGSYLDLDVELLLDFASKTSLDRLTIFLFSTRKLPQTT